MVLIAFALRVAGIFITHTYRFRLERMNFGFGWEMGRIAASLASGQGYANPFVFPTGPTAWEPPLYPFLAAGVMKIFGIYTTSSAIVLLIINCFFSALTCIPLFYLGRRVFGTKVAKWSAWSWALFPYAMYFAVKWIWETSITAFLLTTLLLITLQLEEEQHYLRWVAWGLLWGILGLTNPAILSILPFAGVWLVWRRMRQQRPWFLPSAVAALVFVAVLAPWLARNYRVFHQPVFIRTNFGAEFRLGNGPGANGLWMSWLHPTQNSLQFQRYQAMGELAYVADRKHEAMQWIRAHPREFAKATVARMVYFWTNLPWSRVIISEKNVMFLTSSILAFWGFLLAVKHRRRAMFLFGVLLFAYPIVYYFVFSHPRYRHPIEPAMTLLIVYAISEARELKRRWPGDDIAA